MDQPAIDEEEAAPRFLLTGPARVDAVAAVLDPLQPAGLVVGDGWDRGLLGVVREHGVALLVEDSFDPEADGVHLTDPGRVAAMRAELDRTSKHPLILGADVGLSRHEAMVAGEAGADYVGFAGSGEDGVEDVIELVEWWRSVTVLPCLAYAANPEAAVRLARIGTDFIGVSEAVWQHRDGPVASARELAAALEKT